MQGGDDRVDERSESGVGGLNRRGFLQRAAVGGAIAWTAPVLHQFPAAAQGSPGGGPTTTSTTTTIPPSAPVLLGTHIHAALQPTAWGRRLQEMAIFDGIAFVGYGDWNANSGRIWAGGWHIANAAFTYEAQLDTENTWLHRVVNGRLVVPFIDPRSNSGDFARRSAGSSVWTTTAIDNIVPLTNAGSLHSFDVASFDGTDLWVVGARSGSNVGSVWRSPSGNGGDWVEVLTFPPPVGWNFARYNHIVHYNGRIYVSGYYFSGGPTTPIPGQAWNGVAWVAAPEYTLVGGVHQYGHRPLLFDGWVVRLRAWPAPYTPYPMYFFDGTANTVGPQTAYHHNVDNVGRLWWINSLGEIYKQDPGGGIPTFVVNAPAGASCLAVQGTDLYIGTATSEIWHVSPV